MICPHPWKNIFVTITGDVYPCCFNTKLRSFGNIKEKGILDIWYGEEYEELRQAWADGTWREAGGDGCHLLSLSKGEIAYPESGVQDPISPTWKNHLVNAEEFAQRRARIQSLPETLTYFPFTHCNPNCVFCGQNISGMHDLGDVGYEMLRTVLHGCGNEEAELHALGESRLGRAWLVHDFSRRARKLHGSCLPPCASFCRLSRVRQGAAAVGEGTLPAQVANEKSHRTGAIATCRLTRWN